MDGTDIKEVVKEKYGQAALRVNSGGSSCCGATAASGLACDPITANLYAAKQVIGRMFQQAQVLSFDRVFMFQGILFLGVLPLLFFRKRGEKADETPLVHMD